MEGKYNPDKKEKEGVNPICTAENVTITKDVFIEDDKKDNEEAFHTSI